MGHQRLNGTSHHKTLNALCVLSNIEATSELLKTIEQAPDPVTATRTVLSVAAVDSPVLQEKWRQTVADIWSGRHPHVPLLPQLNLTSDELSAVPMLADAIAYLEALDHQPAHLICDHHEHLLAAADIERLHRALPSSHGQVSLAAETEWSYVHLRRLRSVLQLLRLVRVIHHELVIVRSRYERFCRFPAIQQFYLLWHTDAYHTPWHDFNSLWGDFAQVIQDNLPLLWELHGPDRFPQLTVRSHWCQDILQVFTPLWQQSNLLETPPGWRGWVSVLKQQSLGVAVDHMLLNDLFERYGLITSAEFGHFNWSTIGQAILNAEKQHEMPCTSELF